MEYKSEFIGASYWVSFKSHFIQVPSYIICTLMISFQESSDETESVTHRRKLGCEGFFSKTNWINEKILVYKSLLF